MGNGAGRLQWVNEREYGAITQIRGHEQVCKKLNRQGLTCESNFSQAIKKAHDNKVITKSNVANYKAINRHGNKCKHDWP